MIPQPTVLQPGNINTSRGESRDADVDRMGVRRTASLLAGARLTIPEPGGRYVSVMIINQDRHINHAFHDPGENELTTDRFGTHLTCWPRCGSWHGTQTTTPARRSGSTSCPCATSRWTGSGLSRCTTPLAT